VAVNEDRSGVLLVRVWLEGGSDGFRARLTALGPGRRDDVGEEWAVALASSPRAVADAVYAWLGDVFGSATDRGPDVGRDGLVPGGAETRPTARSPARLGPTSPRALRSGKAPDRAPPPAGGGGGRDAELTDW
jgi:hypothetical protein